MSARSVLGSVAALGAATLAGAGAFRAARHVPLPTAALTFRSNGTTREVGSPHELGHRLLLLCQHPTIAAPDHADTDPAPFHALQETMAALYPRLHEHLELERVGLHGLGLLFRWRGSDPELANAPLLLMAHQDVVPVEGQDWTADPFLGVMEGAYARVTARGTLDNKGSLLTILEAVETLLDEGFQPRRDTYLFFGDCEETFGETAAEVSALLKDRGITPWLLLDEGGAVVEPGMLPGVDRSAAMIAVAEKGIVDIRLTATDPGGHASTPARGGATARIARAILKLEANPFPAHLPEPTRRMLGELGRHAPFGLRLLYANVDPLEPLLARTLAALGPETAAMARTTVATTQLSGAPASNVLATTATATLNVRLAVGTPMEEAVEAIRHTIDDESITITVLSGTEASRVSPVEGEQWELLAALVAEVFPDATTAPYVQNGGTDARRFAPWVDHVYRFSPLRMSGEERARLHAADESISAATLVEGVRFVSRLIEEACG